MVSALQGAEKPGTRLGSYLARVGVSAGILYLVLRMVDLSHLVRLMLSADPGWLALAFVSLLIQQAIMIYMWGDLLRAKGSRLSYRVISHVFFLGIFFGTFLPSTAAVDVVRVAVIARHLKNRMDSVTSMLLFRVIGTVILVAIALVSILFFGDRIGNPAVENLILLFSLAVCGGSLLVTHPRFRTISILFFHRIKIHRLAEITEKFFSSLTEYMRYRSVLARIVLLSLVIQLMRIVTVYWIGLSVDVSASVLFYFLFIPVITVLTMLPVTMAGLGISEGAFVYFFATAGVARAAAVSISLLYFLMGILLFLLSGIVYLFGKTE